MTAEEPHVSDRVEAKVLDFEDERARREAGTGKPPRKRLSMPVGEIAKLRTPPVRSYPSRSPHLDSLIGGGISTRQVLCLLGPPGAGKSAWAVDASLGLSAQLPVLIASTELERKELNARIAGNVMDKPWSAIVRGNVPDAWIEEALAGIPIHVIGSSELPRDGAKALAEIEADATDIAKEVGTPPVIVIDYLQDLARGVERDVRARIGDLASDLRAMSQRLDCAIVMVSSVARSYYSPKRAAELRAMNDPTVYLAAAKESGDVDYASAVVLFLDVEEDDGENKPVRAARIAVAKSRHGRTGFAGARFSGLNGRWTADDAAVPEMGRPAKDAKSEKKTVAVTEDRLTRMHAFLVKMLADGKIELCTYTYLKSNSGCGSDHTRPTLDELMHAGRVTSRTVTRVEVVKGKSTPRNREIFVPVSGGAA